MKLRALLLPVFCSALAAAQTPLPPCGGWSTGWAHPAPMTSFGHDLLNDRVQGLVRYDDGQGPRLYMSGRVWTTPGMVEGQVRRWTGTAWEVLDHIPQGGVFLPDTTLHALDTGSGPELYELRNDFGATARVNRWNGSGWTLLGAPITGRNALDLVVHDDGSGARLYLLAREGSPLTLVSYVYEWMGSAWVQLGPSLSGVGVAIESLDDGAGAQLYVAGKGLLGPTSAIVRWTGSAWAPVGALNATTTALRAFDAGTGPELYASATTPSSMSTCFYKLSAGNWVAAMPLNGSVSAMVQADLGVGQRLYLFGDFPSTPTDRSVRIFDGTTAIAPALPIQISRSVTNALEFPGPGGNQLALAGDFTYVNLFYQGGFSLWDGTTFTPLGAGFTETVYALGSLPNGPTRRIVAGGALRAAGNARLTHRTAVQNATVFEPMTESALDDVLALGSVDLGAGEELYSGRYLAQSSGFELNRWSGTSWLPIAFGGSIHALGSYDFAGGNKLIIAGNFTTPGSRIVAWNGSSFLTLGSGMNNIVAALAVHDEGSGPMLFAAGSFTQAGGTAINRIARWNGSAWSGLDFGIADAGVNALCSFDDGSGLMLYAGGTFTNASGVPVSYIARWNGTSWSDVPGGGASGAVFVLHVHDDGRGPALYVGGGFTLIGGITAYNIARFDGASWEPVFGGTDGVVRAMHSVDDDGDGDQELFIGGDFFATGDVASGKIARLGGCPHYTSFCAGDGSLVDHTTPCPCANNGAPGHGCANPFDASGALLAASGQTNPETLVLAGSGMPLLAYGLYLQHDAAGDHVFHDGVLCAAGNLIRLRNRNAFGGVSTFPDSTDTVTISQRGMVTPGSGALRYYSLFYRSASPSFCPPATANVTNGVQVVW